MVISKIRGFRSGRAEEHRLKTSVSKFMSYILRHDPQGLQMDEEGFVNLQAFVEKLRERYPWVDIETVEEIVREDEKGRYEIRDGRIRAIYGHSINVSPRLPPATDVHTLYHGTTAESAEKICKEGLKPMERRKVHLSAAIEWAVEVAMRRTTEPVILAVDVKRAMESGVRIEKATDRVYVADEIPPAFISILNIPDEKMRALKKRVIRRNVWTRMREEGISLSSHNRISAQHMQQVQHVQQTQKTSSMSGEREGVSVLESDVDVSANATNATNASESASEHVREGAGQEWSRDWSGARMIGGGIPTFRGQERAALRLRNLPVYKRAMRVFVPPDAVLFPVRFNCVRDGKTVVMATPGLKDGFYAIDRSLDAWRLAIRTHGVYSHGKRLHTSLSSIGKIDLMVTGAVAVSTWGERVGKGTGFFDIEYQILREIGAVDEETPIVAIVHDVQVYEQKLHISSKWDVPVDFIVTPSRVIEVKHQAGGKPKGIVDRIYAVKMMHRMRPLREIMMKNR